MPTLFIQAKTFILSLARFLPKKRRARKILFYSVGSALVFLFVYTLFFAPPFNYPESSLVRVKQGSTLSEVAQLFKEKHLVTSATLLELAARLYRSDGTIVAGEYAFVEPQGVLRIASRLVQGDFELAPIRVRVTEGMSVKEITQLLGSRLPDFDVEAFYALAEPKEGYLYPDTYFFMPGEDPELVLDTMVNNFNTQVRTVAVSAAIVAFGKPLRDVLTMASLLEKEASDMQNRRLIAGVLWKRIALGMPLQVDAVFPYIIGKNTYQLSTRDLSTDSPYNTYINKGLPPGPIGSPSVEAILAAVTPIKGDYLYYLADKNGVTHYTASYDQHLRNRQKYLGK